MAGRAGRKGVDTQGSLKIISQWIPIYVMTFSTLSHVLKSKEMSKMYSLLHCFIKHFANLFYLPALNWC